MNHVLLPWVKNLKEKIYSEPVHMHTDFDPYAEMTRFDFIYIYVENILILAQYLDQYTKLVLFYTVEVKCILYMLNGIISAINFCTLMAI